GSSLLLIRRNPIFGLLIFFTTGVTLVFSTAPRYYVMIMPFLLLGSLVMLTRLTDRIPGGWGDLILLAWMGMVTGTNIGRIVPFVAGQHCVGLSASSQSFYAKYREGIWLPVIHLAEVIRQRVPPGQTVISPSPPVVAYLSDRQVLMTRELLPLRKSARRYP